ncbi:MAG: EAL domain-containing protein [Lachnospiraceae bacterium]|nr:EAL domain-containing protein [Lachnospiraceae bacterium]MDD3615362.1 EAL domain-containing protein [Lachnospiraceae bacterium]
MKKRANLDDKLFNALAQCSEHYMIYLCDMKSNISRWSKYAVEYFGLPEEYMENFTEIWIPKIHPEDRHIFQKDIEQVFQGIKENHSCEYRVTNAKGSYVWVHCTGRVIKDKKGQAELFVGTIAHFGTDTKYDSGTNLYSLAQFHNDLNQIVQNFDNLYGLLLIGVDDFKHINDSFGFEFGNKVLRRIASIITAIKTSDTSIYRLDGDKFACICPGFGEEELRNFADRLHNVLASQMIVENRTLYLSYSTGALISTQANQDRDMIFSDLEYALETAKHKGRGHVVFFSRELFHEKLYNQRIQEALLESIRNNFKGFSLNYQPQIDLEQVSLFGAETLLRYYNEEIGGNIPPSVFIPLLEKSGKISEVGKWVLRTALEQMLIWEGSDINHYVSVNVSYIQFRDPDFKKFVVDELARLHYPASKLILELTESCSIEDITELTDTLSYLQEHGIQTSLDDFGTGYASLSVLRILPVDWVKLDYSFVSRLMESEKDQSIIRHIISLCRENHINVCIEGIENQDIEQMVIGYRPQLLQGYYYGRPLPADEYYEKFHKFQLESYFSMLGFDRESIENQKSVLETEKSIVECVEKLISTKDMDSTINMVMDTILEFYKADRSYIFEFDWKKEISINTYERCAPGIASQIDYLKEVPLKVNEYWMEEFRAHRNIWIKNLEDIKEERPEEYALLQPQGINSLIVIPFYQDFMLQGFMGVDNPRAYKNNTYFLNHLTYFISNEISKHQLTTRLEVLSYSDNLTGLQNRNSYARYITEYRSMRNESAGVMFLDLNGLKKINDTFGHEYGDRYIKMLAEILQSMFSKKKIFRISGDEFLVILEGCREEDFICKAEKLRERLSEGDSTLATCGTVWQKESCDIAEMVKRADHEMYNRKREYYQKIQGTELLSKVIGNQSEDTVVDRTAIMESIPAAVAVCDCDTAGVHIVFGNHIFYHMLGENSHSDIQENVKEWIHPDDRERLSRLVIEGAISGEVFAVQIRMKNKKNRYIPVVVSARQAERSGLISRYYAVLLPLEENKYKESK